jgi:hypothetical protein
MNLERNFIIMFVSAGLFGRLTAARASDPGYWSWAQTPPMGWNSWDGFATTIKVKVKGQRWKEERGGEAAEALSRCALLSLRTTK